MGVTHARGTYYTGAAPDVCEFANETVAFAPANQGGDTIVHRFKEDSHTITGGDIRPRTPHEVVTVVSQPARQRLMLVRQNNGEGEEKDAASPAVQNRLEGDVGMAIIRTDDQYFLIENLEANGIAQATQISLEQATEKMAGLVNTWSPQRIRNGQYIGYVVHVGQKWGEESSQIEAMRRQNTARFLKPNSYIAFMKHFPLAAKQTQPVEYKNGAPCRPRSMVIQSRLAM